MAINTKLETIKSGVLGVRSAIKAIDSSLANGTVDTLGDDIRTLNNRKYIWKWVNNNGTYELQKEVNNTDNIAYQKFKSDQSIKAIILPENIKIIYSNAFQDSSLEFINLKDITTVGDRAFLNANLVGTLHLLNATTISNYAFSGNSLVTSILLPSVTTLTGSTWAAGGAFEGCTSLTNVQLNDNLTSIGCRAFFGCTKLASITLPSSLTSTDERVFQDCTALSTIVLPENLKSIGRNLFTNCTALTSITLPSNLVTFGIQVFSGCTALTTINPINTSVISGSLFNNCSALQSVELSSNLTEIVNDSFRNCSALTTLIIHAETVPTLDHTNAFSGTNSNLKIYVPYSSDHSILNNYKAASNWSAYATKIFELNENGSIPT